MSNQEQENKFSNWDWKHPDELSDEDLGERIIVFTGEGVHTGELNKERYYEDRDYRLSVKIRSKAKYILSNNFVQWDYCEQLPEEATFLKRLLEKRMPIFEWGKRDAREHPGFVGLSKEKDFRMLVDIRKSPTDYLLVVIHHNFNSNCTDKEEVYKKPFYFDSEDVSIEDFVDAKLQKVVSDVWSEKRIWDDLAEVIG